MGKAREEILGKTPGDFYNETDSALHWEMTENRFNTHSSQEEEVTITRPDGLKCILISTSTIYTDTTGQEFMVVVNPDITERKRVKRRCGRVRRNTGQPLKTLTDAVSVVNRECKVILVNTCLLEWLRAFGCRDDIIGKQILDAFPFLSPSVIDEYRTVFSGREGSL